MLERWRERRRRRKIVNELMAAYKSGDPERLAAWDRAYMTSRMCDRILAAMRELEEQEKERQRADRHG
jgi:hypothetical protein